MICDTIVARCTPSGSGAIAMVRVSGSNSFNIVSSCCKLSSKEILSNVNTHTIHHGFLVDNNKNPIDEVLFFAMRAPKTFTGEDVIEITCHNNEFIISSIIEQIVKSGARIAQAGEFSKQAVLNCKMDVLKAEALNDLIHASSQSAIKNAMSQMSGTLSNFILKIEDKILKTMAICEASFEFIEEDINFDDQIKSKIEEISKLIDELLISVNSQSILRDGIKIALLGSVNVGKSSLFNILIKKNRSIVTNIAGTTRDVVESGIYQNGAYLTFVDTAGLRQTNNIIEKEGIERSLKQAEISDIILLVFDGSINLTNNQKTFYSKIENEHSNKIIKIFNKSDISNLQLLNSSEISVSTKTDHNIENLHKLITTKIDQLISNTQMPFLITKRQASLILQFKNDIEIIQKDYLANMEYELISIHLNNSIAAICELTGKTISEKALDTIFKEFCVGK